jgi:hypothetical protein
MRLTISPLTLAAAVLLACPGPKESETTATTGDSGDETIGHSSNSQSGTATGTVTSNTTNSSNTTVPPDPTGGPDETTSTTATTVATSTTTPPDDTTGTGGQGCVPDPPEPKMCNKAKNAYGGDHDAIGASTGDCQFICPADLGGGGNECDIFEQNCPEGQKCNAWSSDGDNSWDATKCVPVDADPDPIGAPCTVEGSGVSGVDSCVKGAMCWGVDVDTGMGTCIEQCTCSIDNPICAVTPNSSCTIANEGVIVLCLPSCDPLNPGSCSDGDVCIGNPGDPNTFICVVDASGDGGGLLEPCEFVNACDSTLLCGSPELLPGCDVQAAGCCVPFCDIGAIDCPQGADCLPWFEEGQAPKCFEHIGVCGTSP